MIIDFHTHAFPDRIAHTAMEKLSFAFDCRCFFGTIVSVLKSDGVVEGGTGQLEKEKGKK